MDASAYPRSLLPPTNALALKGLILVTFLAASAVPSPLYALYRAAWGFSALTLTVVFASYAIALLAALLVFGALSDYRGRREVIALALVLEIGSLLIFREATSVDWLLAARVLQGVATGIATTALSAGMVDLHRERGALVNSIAPMVGLGAGALGAALLVQFAPQPMKLVFDLLLAIMAAELVATAFLPETVQRRPGAWRSLRPRLALPANVRAALVQVLPVNTAQWAVGGFYFSLGPSLAAGLAGSRAPLVGGTLIAVLSFTSATAIALARKVPPPKALAAGAAALSFGALLTLVGIHWVWPIAAIAGTMITGAGFGTAFSGSVRTLVPLAAPHERAATMAAFFAASYLAFSLPAILAGLLTTHIGLHATALGYGMAAALLAASTLLTRPSRPRT
ncbi:MFS transporter [Ramlibacter albus]|uniref:MFS transporter n=1 Tax=Ramlibacter albus TaxID=2079448 RepID=A0A923M8P3_9BURK|nr:MFS transporter [Ramlibacter albus]MBC5765736.1 MFS transporter [Ramlibacter albus]